MLSFSNDVTQIINCPLAAYSLSSNAGIRDWRNITTEFEIIRVSIDDELMLNAQLQILYTGKKEQANQTL